MQTSLARRQRHRRIGNRNRPTGIGAVRAGAIALPIFLFSTLLFIGFLGFAGAVSAYNFFSRDLADPKAVLETLVFDQQSRLFDRTGKVELAKLGDDRRELVTFEQLPPQLVDATTAIEDKTFWENSGFDPAGFISAAIDTLQGEERGGSTITQQLVRARLLPQSAFDGSVYERKVKEIIQSIRLTDAYPGLTGKQKVMAAYLNQNFYGNRSYGVRAAAQTYFGIVINSKTSLKDLTLAQMALLAAIPQSPTKFDLVKNAVEEPYTDDKGVERVRLRVPDASEVVVRRNYILDLLATDPTRRVLSGDVTTAAQWEAAKQEPVYLISQASPVWRAPQFVWQARDELAKILCGERDADACPDIDSGGYTVKTSLDWDMQRTVEKWLFVAARGPNSKNPAAIYRARLGSKLKRFYDSSGDWLNKLRGRNIHNAASAIVDYRNGQVLAYAGSASYTAAGTAKFQPQFDVLEDGWRQPGSAIKPLDYLIGIDEGNMTAATMFVDAVTNFAPKGAKAFKPTQADHLERGPVRLRSALQFSLNIPAIKSGFLNGIEHQFEKTKEFGLRYARGTVPVISESIGTLEVHPIDLTSAYGAIANAGVLMERQLILEVRDRGGRVVWPTTATKPEGKRIASAQAAYIITDILAGNTDPDVNPFWAEWRVHDGLDSPSARTRPAAYKTGTTSDNVDVAAYGYLAPPKDKNAPALVVGVWMGNSNNDPNKGSLSLDSSAPLWSAIMSEASKGMPIAKFTDSKPGGLVTAQVDAITGMKPRGGRTVTELFIKGTAPTKTDNLHVVLDVDQATGLRWQEGCAGPMITRSFLDLRRAESRFPQWRQWNLNWQRRAAAGGRGTTPFYNSQFRPFGGGWGARFAPTALCPIAAPEPTPCVEVDPASPCPSLPPEESPVPTKPPKP
jgi:peptidoglycan glycosyltransferase